MSDSAELELELVNRPTAGYNIQANQRRSSMSIVQCYEPRPAVSSARSRGVYHCFVLLVMERGRVFLLIGLCCRL